MQIDIYTVDYCPYCHKALNFLKSKGVEFTNHDITDDEDNMRIEIGKKYDIQGDVTVPQIIIDGKRIGGYSDLLVLEETGKLPF